MPRSVWTVTDRNGDGHPMEYANNLSHLRVLGGHGQWRIYGDDGMIVRGEAGKRRCFKSSKAAMAAVDAMPDGTLV